jgi:hypothetical protein
MLQEGSWRVRKPKARTEVFLNLPYDPKYKKIFLAYICAAHAFGMTPRVALEIAGNRRRLDRIFDLLRSCRYSIHDLSKVQLDRKKPCTPRFNMPFELGLAIAWERMKGTHTSFVMEAVHYRLSKSLSDLNGTDPCIHKGTVEGVFREMCNAFARSTRQPTSEQMWEIYWVVRGRLPRILRQTGARSLFEPSVFRQINVVASTAAGAITK